MDSIAEEEGDESLPPRRPIGPTGEPCEFIRTAQDKVFDGNRFIILCECEDDGPRSLSPAVLVDRRARA